MSRWDRISVELSSTWPGEAYLRFQNAGGPAVMVAVDQDDLARIQSLANALGPSRSQAAAEDRPPAPPS
jgi:hypothetical protein